MFLGYFLDDDNSILTQMFTVITSYSIHYTKLYEAIEMDAEGLSGFAGLEGLGQMGEGGVQQA